MSSRVFGLIRDILIARMFGSQDVADAFFVAFKIPNFFRRLFGEGAFSQSFVPVLSDYRINSDSATIKQFIQRVGQLLGGVLTLFVMLVVIGSSVVAFIFAPGFIDEPDKFDLTSQMIKLTFPYLLFISLAGFCGSILNAYDRFAVPAATPVILNICLISAALVSHRYFEEPILALAWGVLVAGVLQFVFQLPFLKQIDRLPTPQFGYKSWLKSWNDSGVKRVLKLMTPAIFGVSVSQINLLFDTLIASFLISGSVSWLYYSDRLIELPLGVFGIAIATIILPKLSRAFVKDGGGEYNHTMDWALKMVLLIGVPATCALAVLSQPILSTLFLYGSMTENDIAMASLSLIAYCTGLIAFMLIKVLAAGFYSRQNTKTPVKIGIIAMVSNMVLNIVFVLPLYYWWGIGHVGLALATAVSAWINAGLLYWSLRKQDSYQHTANWLSFFTGLFIAIAIMLGFLIVINFYWNQWSVWSAWERSWHLLFICLGGGVIYSATVYYMKIYHH